MGNMACQCARRATDPKARNIVTTEEESEQDHPSTVGGCEMAALFEAALIGVLVILAVVTSARALRE